MASTPGDASDDAGWDDHTQVGGSQLLSQEGIYQLTQDLRSFSEGLTNLKAVFSDERAHQRLGELLRVLKYVINKYSELNSSTILSAAEGLITQVKTFNYETAEDNVPPDIFSAINNLALAFSASVSECLVGDMNISPTRSVLSAQSTENISSGVQKTSGYDPDAPTDINETDVDGLPATESSVQLPHENLEICFERSKAWFKYAGDLITYVKKKAHIENEYAKSLSKLSQQTRTILSEQSFLPFQSLYCTAIDQDREFASNSITTYQNFILAHKFIEPLQAKRNEHDRRYKALREAWRKDKRRLDEAENNLKKAKQQYQARNQEYQKAKDAAIRVETEQQQSTQMQAGESQHSRQSSGANSTTTLFSSVQPTSLTFPSSKIEKKKKQEEETYLKASQAEHYYRACVNEANSRRRELERKEEEYLQNLKDLMMQCEQTMKSVTAGYFSLHYQLYSPLPVQFQALQDDSKSYEPGFQYAEYLRHLMPQHEARNDYKFEPYPAEGHLYFDNPAATGNLHLPYAQAGDTSPLPSRGVHGGRGISDTESSSSRSLDDLSPAASPNDTGNRKKDYSRRRDSNEGSISSNELLDDKDDNPPVQVPSPESSPAATQKVQKTLKNTLFKNFAPFKGRRSQKQSMFGVDFLQVANESADGIPFIIKKCITEIDNRALTNKGIYRVNGVKLRVEKLCSMLDLPNGDKLDLSDQSPRDLSGVLKFFLRQLPEPLLLFRLYKEFLEVAREYQAFVKSETQRDESTEDVNQMQYDEEGRNSLLFEERSMQSNMILTRMHSTVNKLPEPNRNTLQYIISHLSRIAAHSEENKMTASNLAIVFGPNLLRPAQLVGNELAALMDLPAQSQCIKMLIVHRDIIFDTYSRQAQSEVRATTSIENLVDVPSVTQAVTEEGDNSTVPLKESSTESLEPTPTTTDQVVVSIDDSPSHTRSSSSDDLLSTNEDAAITLPIHRLSLREQEDDFTAQVNVTQPTEPLINANTGTIVSDSSGIIQHKEPNNNTDLNSFGDNQTTVAESNEDVNVVLKENSFPTIFEAKVVRNETVGTTNPAENDIPVVPIRKSKRKSHSKQKQPRVISAPTGFTRIEGDEDLKSMAHRNSHTGVATENQININVIPPSQPSTENFVINKKESTGRQLPHIPSITRKKNSLRGISNPGRTPPHHSKQLQTWSFPEEQSSKEQKSTPLHPTSVSIGQASDEEVSYC